MRVKNKIQLLAVVILLIMPSAITAQAIRHSENDPLFFLRELPKPNVMIMADTSGSMLFNYQGEKTVRNTTYQTYYNVYALDSDAIQSRMKQLKNGLSQLIEDKGSVMNFGLARFNNWTQYYYYIANTPYTFTSSTTIYKYCYDQDHKDSIPHSNTDCIYMDRVYEAGWSQGSGYIGSFNCTRSTPPDDNDATYLAIMKYDQSTQQFKRYRFVGCVTKNTGTSENMHIMTIRQYDPRDNNPPYPGTTVTETWNGISLDFKMTDIYVYTGQYSYGLYMPTDSNNIPHISVDIRNDYEDDPLTPWVDEADNTAKILGATGLWWEEGAFVPGGGTPLTASFQDAATYFQQTIIPRDDPYPKKKACRKNYVIAITDGESTTTGEDIAVRDLFNSTGVKTYIIALALSDTVRADKMADYGDDGLRNYSKVAYKADNTEQLLIALDEIVADISDQFDTLAPPVVSTASSHPYDASIPQYAGENDSSEAVMVLPYFQFPSWRGHLLATWLYYIEWNPRIPDDPATGQDERWITYDFNPHDLWNAGYLLSWQNAPIEDTNSDTYINEADTLQANTAYKAADDRVIYTTALIGGNQRLIPFDTDLDDKVERLGVRDVDIPTVMQTVWGQDKARRQYLDLEEVANVVINYIRGKEPRLDRDDDDSDGSALDWLRDPSSGEIVYKERTWKLGNSVMSVPAVIGTPSGTFRKKFFSDDKINPGEQAFDDFAQEMVNRPNVVLYGANDGLLHCFALDDIFTSDTFGPSGIYSPPRNYKAGEEIWAIVPGDTEIMEKLKWLVVDYNGEGLIDGQIYQERQSFNYTGEYEWTHWYFVDGPTRYANVFIDTDNDGIREWKTVVLKSLGRGGSKIYSLDLTNPFDPRLMWVFPDNGNDNDNMGLAVSIPAIAHQAKADGSGYRWIAIFGAGYDPADDPATERGQHIFTVDIKDGSLVYDFDEPAKADSGSKKAMVVAAPAVLNSNIGTDYTDNKAFVGDTDGRLWKIDLISEEIFKRLDLNTENQPIIAGVTAAHAYGDTSWWDIIFLGTGGDTRVKLSDEPEHSLVGFIDEAHNLPFVTTDPTILPSGSQDYTKLPNAIYYMADPSTFNPTPYVFFHVYLDDYDRNDAQPSTNVVEASQYSLLQTFFTIFNPGEDPCKIGYSYLLEIDHKIDKADGAINRVPLPVTGDLATKIELGEGKSGGTYISDGVLIAPSKDKLHIEGSPVPPPPPKGAKVVVNVLSWKVITD